jgi:hypothetical protein
MSARKLKERLLVSTTSSSRRLFSHTTSSDKPTVYHALQSAPDESSTNDDLATLEHKIITLGAKLTSAKTTEGNLKLHLTALSNMMTIEELSSKVSELGCEEEKLIARVTLLQEC